MERTTAMINPKYYLNQYRQNMNEIKDLDVEIEQLESHLLSVTAPTDKEPVMGGKGKDMAGSIAKIADMQNEVKAMRIEAVEQMHEIETVLGQIENKDYVHILRLRYIHCLTFEKIAVETNYSYRWICVLHGRALQEVSKIING